MQKNQDLSRAIEEIKARISLEEIVGECTDGEFVQRSRRLWCNCPFHDENTPSFAIDPASGLWYCFGACSEGGDLIKFVQRRHNTAFWDSLEWLASRASVELPKRSNGSRKNDPGFAVLADTEKYYRSALNSAEGRGALNYLQSRGISEGAIEAFGLGYAPASGQALTQRARTHRIEGLESAEKQLELYTAAGLLRRSDGGRVYDFFRGRLMIPIRDDRGRTVGFGARRLDRPTPAQGANGDGRAEKEGPKYINTPETPWFHKGRIIYGYDRASDTVRRGGHLVLMEGYTDVICAHQAGFKQACAVLGTATTDDHARLARKAGTRRITLVFDGDDAGRKAAWKALAGLLPLEIDLDVAVPPQGQDPADLVAGGDAGPLMALLEQADPWVDFVIASLSGLTGRAISQGVDRILELFGRIPKPVYHEACMMELAEATGIPVQSLRTQRDQLPERRRAQAQRLRNPSGGNHAGGNQAARGRGPQGSGFLERGIPETAQPSTIQPDQPARRAVPTTNQKPQGPASGSSAGDSEGRWTVPVGEPSVLPPEELHGDSHRDGSSDLIPGAVGQPSGIQNVGHPNAAVHGGGGQVNPNQGGNQAQNQTISPEKAKGPVDPRVGRAYRGVIGAALCDTSLIPRVRPLLETCELPGAKAILLAMLGLWDNDDPDAPDVIGLEHIINALGDHPVRDHVASIVHYVEQAEDLTQLLESELNFLNQQTVEVEKRELEERAMALESQVAYDPSAAEESMRCLARLHELNLQAQSNRSN